MSNILFKRGSQSALNTLKSGNKGIEGAFYLTEDTHRLYAGMSGGKIVDLNQYITVVDAVANLNTVNAQKGDFAYIKAGNILAVYTNDDPQNPWVQINQNTDTTYTIQAAGDKATDPGTLSLSLYDQKDALASTANIKFIGTKGADVTVKEDGTVEVKGNPYTFVKDFGTPDGDGYVTKMDVTLTPEDAEEGVAATKFNITAGKNIEFKKNADGEGITIEGVDGAAFADADCTLNVNGGNATLTLALTNNEDVVIQAVNANADGKAPFHLNYGIDAKSTVNNQGDMQVYTMDEVDGLIANLNAMTYVGPLPTGGLPTSGVSIGDTYMSDRAYSFYLGTGNLVSTTAKTGYEEFTAKVGDLFIATSKTKAENADGVIDAVNLQWTYIPSGDDSQTDTTYYCSLNQNTNTFTICDKHDAAIGHIQVVGDSMITVKSVLDNANGKNPGIATPWQLSLEHAKVTTAAKTDGANDLTSVTAISDIKTDDYGHITEITTYTAGLAKYKISGATATVNSNAATFTHTVSDSKDGNTSSATMKIDATADDNLTIVANGSNGIKISMEWGTF